MSRISWKLHLQSAPDPQATDLRELAQKIGDSGFSESTLDILGNQSFRPPRSIEAILEDISNHQTEQITRLEWFFCLYKKSDWDQHHPQQVRHTSTLIWEAAKNIQWLRERLLWRLALYYDGDRLYYDGDRQQILPDSMIQTFQLEHIPSTNNYESTRTILSAASQKNASELANHCLSASKLPCELLEVTKLPTHLQVAQEALIQIPQQLASRNQITHAAVDLLIRCLEQLSEEHQVEAVNHVLISIKKEVASQHPKLVDWLTQNYGVSQANSRWGRLSETAKKNLRKWIGATNYSDFQRLVDRVIERLKLDEREERQLKSRREFWSNYSDRFERIRILLPQSTDQVLSQDFKASDISVFTEHSRDLETEVCIFDFGDWYVVEFFRGAGSETRLFEKKPISNLSKKLFESAIPSPTCLRCLGGISHDHCYCWQISCEQWLRERGIRPNAGLTQFQRVDAFDRYDSEKGLEFPSDQARKKREPQEIKAKKQTQKLEQKAQQNCCGHWKQ
jgi:hypothetical protein